jgi:hypothetical protein
MTATRPGPPIYTVSDAWAWFKRESRDCWAPFEMLRDREWGFAVFTFAVWPCMLFLLPFLLCYYIVRVSVDWLISN